MPHSVAVKRACWSPRSPPVHFMTRRFCHLEPAESFSHFKRSQFVVSRRRVLSRPLIFYEQMLAMLAPERPANQDAEYLKVSCAGVLCDCGLLQLCLSTPATALLAGRLG